MRFLAYTLLGAVAFGCSDGNPSPAEEVGGAAGSTAPDGGGAVGGGGTSGTRDAGPPDSMGGSAPDGGDAEPPLVDPDENEACVADPNPASWYEEALSFEALGARGVSASAALGGGVTLLAARIVTSFEPSGALYVTSSIDGAAWADPLLLSATPDFFDGPFVRVASDGSGGIALWVEADETVRYATWLAGRGWDGPQLLEGARAVRDVVALPGGAHALTVGGNLRIIDSPGQQTAETPLPGGLSHRLFLGPGDRPVLYVTSVLISAGSSRYEYTPGSGFGPAEAVPLMASRPSGWQEFWFEATTGVGARIIRSQGTHITVRRGALGWTEEEQVTSDDGTTGLPSIAAAGSELIFLWAGGGRIVERAHDGNAWSPERALSRSSNLQLESIAGTNSGAGLVATLTLDGVEVSKLFRRGSDGTWYCPRLVHHGFLPTVASAPTGELLFVGDRAGTVRLARFRP